ncbi:ring-cleaving dioxygenase [Paenibacillus ihumii]|uniref:ring-cleaving dioxygenase n=1 Tax=Paenibacillus ihumii TaxID=687436 RepID=UPI0006D76ADF|nr:ring-cleaving dioxygenase [Paenibacillus ihumii]
MPTTTGIHHITAFVGDVQGNVDFYAGVLGLRLVKKTVNFDAPEVYHLYFGNESGSPGTIITFFPQDGAEVGMIGGGQVGVTVFAVPPGSLLFWRKRLKKFGIPIMDNSRFGEDYVRFTDNSGLLIDLVERAEGPESTWSFGGVPQKYAIKGFGGALLFSSDSQSTARVLELILDMKRIGEEEGLIRYQAAGDLGNWIDLNAEDIPRSGGGAGTVHHIAWRAKDDEEQEEWRRMIEQCGLHPTRIMDRDYFKALYFREPGGILFEIATDPPGFTVDEPLMQLGEKLMLPDRYEPHRSTILSHLSSFQVRFFEFEEEAEEESGAGAKE